MPELRLDTELVRRGLARSRTHASRLIAAHRVTIAGRPADKAARRIALDVALEVAPQPGSDGQVDFASRGADKLRGAIDTFAVPVTGRTALDAGASTGGFTDLLLRRGATAVVALDVGTGQLDPRLSADPRVTVMDRTNVRSLDDDAIARVARSLGGTPDIIVADLSFISLTLALPALVACAGPGSDLLPMVKPQFEVGRGRLGAHGVVRDPRLRTEAVARVAQRAADLGRGLAGVVASPLPGPTGNVEYFLHLRADAPTDPARSAALIDRAVREGPQ